MTLTLKINVSGHSPCISHQLCVLQVAKPKKQTKVLAESESVFVYTCQRILKWKLLLFHDLCFVFRKERLEQEAKLGAERFDEVITTVYSLFSFYAFLCPQID